jgi:parallel beta helix pectate lyase-like protein
MKLRSAVVVLSFVVALQAGATQQRSFVAVNGVDGNPCTRDLPCRNFAAAVTQTNPNGEVVAIDSAGYGPVTITQPVTLVAPIGVHAGISAFSGTGVTVNAPGGVVVLRNLYINGQGGTTGVDLVAASTLYVEHCTINGFTGNGINLTPAAGSAVFINDTTVRECGQSGIYGNSATFLHLSVAGCRIENTQYGLAADGGRVSARDTVVDRISDTGFYARGLNGGVYMTLENCFASGSHFGVQIYSGTVAMHGGGATGGLVGYYVYPIGLSGLNAILLLEGCVVTNNGVAVDVVFGSDVSIVGCSIVGNNIGIDSETTAPILRLSRSTITRNTTGLSCSSTSTTFHTTGDNVVEQNGTDNSGCTLTPATKM